MQYIFDFIWIIASYVLGSIPFGYVITRLTTGKNILEVGWEKTSGSNVFKNIGKTQGVLTGLLDLGKGFAAVWLSQYFNLQPLTQALCGVAAVSGHNWSCFLGFAGGRGIGTYVGAALALSPRIIGLALPAPLIGALIWNAAPATILLLVLFIFLSFCSKQVLPSGLFGILSLMPVFLKRLSPISDFKKKPLLKERRGSKKEVIKNRLLFDDDRPYWELRIKRIFDSLTKQ